MDIYTGRIKNKRLYIPRHLNKGMTEEAVLLHKKDLMTYKPFMTSYFRFDGMDLLALYSNDNFDKIWNHILHPKPKGADFTEEEINDIIHTRRVIFPFSEWTYIDLIRGNHVKFNEYSLKEFYRLESAKEAGKLKTEVRVLDHGNKLMVVKPENLEAFLKMDEEMNKKSA